MFSAFILSVLTNPRTKKGKYRILTLTKPIFNEDTKAIDAASKDLCFLMFPRLLLAEYSKHLSNRLQPNDGMWTVIYDGTPEQQKVSAAVDRMFTHLHRFIKFDAIFAGNYVYSSQQELFKAATKRRIPVIVLYKEGLAPQGSMTKRVSNKLYKDKQYFGNKILFYNAAIRDAILKANIPGINKDNSSIVGIPRIDKFLQSSYKHADANSIVLFAFDPVQKAFRYIDDKSKLQAFIDRGNNFHSSIIRFCLENPQYHLTIKTKGSQYARKMKRMILSDFNIKTIPQNIEITHSTSSYTLVLRSKYVLGFTSTTLLEAMILDRFILCPYFHDLIPVERTDYFSDYPNMLNYIENFNQLEKLLAGEISLNIAGTEIKNKALKPMLYRLDGRASQRVDSEIIKTIKSSRKDNIPYSAPD